MKKIIFLIGLFVLTLSSPLQAASSVCFSPEGKCDQKLIEFINSAKTSIDMAIYSLTLSSVASALISAQDDRGIEVRVLVDQSQAHGTASVVTKLIDAGISVRYGDQEGLMHHKFTIIDGVKLETGSFNYSLNGSSKNAENALYLDDSGIIKEYIDEFETIWKMGYSATETELLML